MAYLKERVAQEEYNKALMERHPLMNAAANMAGQSSILATNAATQMWPSNPGVLHSNVTTSASSYPYERNTSISQFQVEKVDNGFIIRSGKYSKICKDMTELSEQFIAIMVEAQLDK